MDLKEELMKCVLPLFSHGDLLISPSRSEGEIKDIPIWFKELGKV